MTPDTPGGRIARLEATAEALNRSVDRLDEQVRTFGPLAGQIIEAASDVQAVREAQSEIRQLVRESEARLMAGLREVTQMCDRTNESRKQEAAAIRREFIADADRRSELRGKIVVAIIGSSAVVFAAILGLLGVALKAGGVF